MYIYNRRDLCPTRAADREPVTAFSTLMSNCHWGPKEEDETCAKHQPGGDPIAASLSYKLHQLTCVFNIMCKLWVAAVSWTNVLHDFLMISLFSLAVDSSFPRERERERGLSTCICYIRSFD